MFAQNRICRSLTVANDCEWSDKRRLLGCSISEEQQCSDLNGFVQCWFRPDFQLMTKG